MSCCKGTIMNSGTTKSVVTSPTVTAYLWPRYGADANLNCIKKTDFVNGVLPQAFIDALINAPNYEDRLYPLPEFKNVTNERAESVKQSFDDGSSAKIRDGIRNFSAFLPQAPASYLDVFAPANCGEMAIILVGECGEITGYTPDKGSTFYPLPISKGSMDAIYQWATNASVSGNNVAFEFSRLFTDSQISVITAEGTEFDALGLRGLFDVVGSGSSIATASTLLYLVNYGMDFDVDMFLSTLVDGDIVIKNETQGDAVVTIDSFDLTNAAEGVYVLAHAAGVVSTDILRFESIKAGYVIPDFKTITA